MAKSTTTVSLSYVEADNRFVFSGLEVVPLGGVDQYHAIFMPEGTQPGDVVTTVFELASPAGIAFGTSPVQWVALMQPLSYYQPLEPSKDEIQAVRRVSDTRVEIDVVIAADDATYRCLLITFYEGNVVNPVDPTIINRPKNPGGQ